MSLAPELPGMTCCRIPRLGRAIRDIRLKALLSPQLTVFANIEELTASSSMFCTSKVDIGVRTRPVPALEQKVGHHVICFPIGARKGQ